MHTALSTTLATHYPDASFATGILGRIELDTGALSWTNAGHPPPLLIRGGHVVDQLKTESTSPWGLPGSNPTPATGHLEPDDCLLLYTDGVTEARTPDGDEFGLDRLIDLTNRNASVLLRPEAMVRLLVHSVRDHQRHDLADDATIVLVRWHGPH